MVVESIRQLSHAQYIYIHHSNSMRRMCNICENTRGLKKRIFHGLFDASKGESFPKYAKDVQGKASCGAARERHIAEQLHIPTNSKWSPWRRAQQEIQNQIMTSVL